MQFLVAYVVLVSAVSFTAGNPMSPPASERSISPAEDKLFVLSQSLKFGDECDQSIENFRDNLTRALLDYPTTSMALILDETTETARRMTAKNEPMCNAKRKLICGPSSTCICGDPGFRLLQLRYPLAYKRDGSQCVRPKNTVCLPTDDDGIEDCEAGSLCRVRSDGRRCTNAVWNNYGVNRLFAGKTIKGAMKEFLDSKVCQCIPHEDIMESQQNNFAIAPIENYDTSRDGEFADSRGETFRGDEFEDAPVNNRRPSLKNSFLDDSTPRNTPPFRKNNLDDEIADFRNRDWERNSENQFQRFE